MGLCGGGTPTLCSAGLVCGTGIARSSRLTPGDISTGPFAGLTWPMAGGIRGDKLTAGKTWGDTGHWRGWICLLPDHGEVCAGHCAHAHAQIRFVSTEFFKISVSPARLKTAKGFMESHSQLSITLDHTVNCHSTEVNTFHLKSPTWQTGTQYTYKGKNLSSPELCTETSADSQEFEPWLLNSN